MRRIVILGNTGSGKTTLARDLSRRLGIPHVELDELYWGPSWTPADESVFRERTSTAINEEAWIVDGNYSQVRDILWPRADTLVWLDLPQMLVWWRLLRREVSRLIKRELLWGTNYETFRGTFLSGDSLLLFSLRNHNNHRRRYPPLFRQPEYAHLNVIRLTSPAAARCWLEAL